MIFSYIETQDGKLKRSSLETLTYSNKLSTNQNVPLVAICLGTLTDKTEVSKYGVDKLYYTTDKTLGEFDSKMYTRIIAEKFEESKGKTLVLPFNQNGKAIGPRLSVRLHSGYLAGATSMPNEDGEYSKNIFSGKAKANYKIQTELQILGISPNTIEIEEMHKPTTEYEEMNISESMKERGTKILKREMISGQIPLSEANIVVSGGRGMKGPENWGAIEECAKILGAATACSRPVADVHWRPHHEHVGQTGLAISPDLYIAIGISGAIQHLAGVSNSKTILVINTDKEAPFFKAADYGIIGDAMEVLPALNSALKKYKGL